MFMLKVECTKGSLMLILVDIFNHYQFIRNEKYLEEIAASSKVRSHSGTLGRN